MGRKGKRALVLVHVSSLDAFADYFKLEDPTFSQAWALSDRMARAAIAHDGPVVIVDQDWPHLGEHSEPRRAFEDKVARSGRPITRMHFDEEEEDWTPFLRRLRRTLKDAGITRVILGGVWFDPSEASGCVTATYKYLENKFDTSVASDLVGCGFDIKPWHPESWTYEEAIKKKSPGDVG